MIGDRSPLMMRLHASVGPPVPRVTEQDAAAIVSHHYGLDVAAISRIDSSHGDRFIVAGHDATFLLKIARPDADPLELDLHVAAMEHVRARNPQLRVQELILTTNEDTSVRISTGRTARVFTLLSGVMLQDVVSSPAQLRQCGRILARLSRALADFDHPYADRYDPWDLQHVDELDELLAYVEHPERREAVSRTLETIMRVTLPVLRTTRSQVVHNAFHGNNLIADPAAPDFITGILGFSHTVRSYLAADLAVAMSYAHTYAVNGMNVSAPGTTDSMAGATTRASGGPWAAASAMLIGYTGVTGLSVTELDVIPDLVLGRLAQQILLGSWFAANVPGAVEHAPAIERELEQVWQQFEDMQASRP